jgi:anthranilate synthase/aminodeoxychorismate synthase-like glutamine amidotransferase
MILMIDNYDSFTYNLVQYLGELGQDVRVCRNNRISLKKISSLRPESIIISPGPWTPDDAGISREAIRAFAGRIPIMGVCLGHQCIGDVFGGRIVQAGRLMHGKTSLVYHDVRTIFKGLSNPFEATRYHSLLIERRSIPDALEISAWTREGEIMGVRLKKKVASGQWPVSSKRNKAFHSQLTTHNSQRSICPVEGVQFHPESILTAEGKKLLKNFLNISRIKD